MIKSKKQYVEKKRDVEHGSTPRMTDGLKIFYSNVSIYDGQTGELLAIFLKNILPKYIIDIGRKLIAFEGKSDVRGAYAGKKIVKIIQSGKHKGERDMKGRSANSSLVGYLMPYLVKNPKPQLSSTSKKDLELYEGDLKTLYKYIDKIVRLIDPNGYKENLDNMSNVPDNVRISKIITNVQINVNQVAHYHIDSGNKNQYGTILTFYPSGTAFKGGEFVLGDYNIGFDLKEGDLLYINQHSPHGTLPFKGDRLSAVGFQSTKLLNYYDRQKGEGKFPKTVYVIPSYDRLKTLIKQTLTFLERYKIDKNDIYIFVANKEQYDIYEPVLRPMGYKNIIIGILGLKKVIRFIQNYFPNGQQIVHINDDVRGLKTCSGDGKKMVDVPNLKTIIKRGFDLLHTEKLQLFGFYPIVNELFQCKQTPITTKLKFIVGSMYGYINDKSLISKSDVVLKEDYERSITSYLKYGGVIRFNRIGIITTYANSSGGVSELRKVGGLEKKESYYLKNKYPNLVHFLNRKRVKEGYKFDISLRD